MKIYGLTGNPLKHSRSPEIFAAIFKSENVKNKEYRLFPLENIEQLPQLLKHNPDIHGLNVTIPFKVSILKYADQLDETAKQTGACNTLKITRSKSGFFIQAFNTDVFGFEYSFSKYLKPFHRKALILGSGGSSKAVQYVLEEKNIPFLVVSRKPSSPLQISYEKIKKELLKQHQIIINTTPVGMFPETENMPPLPYNDIRSSHLLFDLIYNPIRTKFLEQGIKAGATVVNGEEMLLKQAEKSWRIWNGNLSIR